MTSYNSLNQTNLNKHCFIHRALELDSINYNKQVFILTSPSKLILCLIRIFKKCLFYQLYNYFVFSGIQYRNIKCLNQEIQMDIHNSIHLVSFSELLTLLNLLQHP